MRQALGSLIARDPTRAAEAEAMLRGDHRRAGAARRRRAGAVEYRSNLGDDLGGLGSLACDTGRDDAAAELLERAVASSRGPVSVARCTRSTGASSPPIARAARVHLQAGATRAAAEEAARALGTEGAFRRVVRLGVQRLAQCVARAGSDPELGRGRAAPRPATTTPPWPPLPFDAGCATGRSAPGTSDAAELAPLLQLRSFPRRRTGRASAADSEARQRFTSNSSRIPVPLGHQVLQVLHQGEHVVAVAPPRLTMKFPCRGLTIASPRESCLPPPLVGPAAGGAAARELGVRVLEDAARGPLGHRLDAGASR